MKRKVTVVIPTYRRAHLLHETIPTYLQDDVEELILIDDCSPDDTPAVALKLIELYPNIRYYRNEQNLKQTVSKNRGKALARTDFIYFGDDDSVLSEGGIAQLLATAEVTSADIVGASALYLKSSTDAVATAIAERSFAASVTDIINLPTLEFDFTRQAPRPLEMPVCHASFLARAPVVKALDFDDGYIGNCYREETDFLLRCWANNAKIVFESRVTQTNLPPSVATGGARGRSRLAYECYALYNTVRFVLKNKAALQAADSRCNSTLMIFHYIKGRAKALARRLYS